MDNISKKFNNISKKVDNISKQREIINNKKLEKLIMGKTVVIYGSTTGSCEAIANTIASKLGAEAINVTSMTAEIIAEYDSLVLGSSTWGYGELQDDWYDGVKVLKSADLSSKSIALFGCGDAESYCDTFCDAIGLIYQEIANSGATFVGSVSKDGYSYSGSAAEVDGKLLGLALDDINDCGNTNSKIDAWVDSIKGSL